MKTPISYYGGKQRMVQHILPLIPAHRVYVEPFFGGGAVFFAKSRSFCEVINDVDNRVVNFYEVMQTDFESLQTRIKATLHSEWQHKRAAEILKAPLQDRVEYAWAFWVQTNMSFGNALFKGFAFSESGEAENTAGKRARFGQYADRLAGVEIFCRDACGVIRLKDGPETFFYVDPPYVSSDAGHYAGYTAEDFTRLLEALSGIQGRFLLSSYPEPQLADYRAANGWRTQEIRKALAVDGRRKETAYKTECLTMNYEPTGVTIGLFDEAA